MAAAQEKAGKSAAYWIWCVVNALLALIIAGLVALLLMGRENAQLEAISSGQRLTISIKNGDVTGTMRSGKPDTPPDAKPNDAPDTPDEEEQETPSIPDSGADVKKKPAFDVGESVEAEKAGSPKQKGGDVSSLVASEEDAAIAIPVQPRTAASLNAPAEGLMEKTANGALPNPGPEGTPRRYYARPFPVSNPRRAAIAILILDMGSNHVRNEEAMHLPPEVAYAYSPYARDAKLLIENARNLGHEVWMLLPAQPNNFPASDPGPLSLLKSLGAAENIARLRHLMTLFPGYVGFTLPTNEVISDMLVLMEPITKELEQRGLAIIAAEAPDGAGPSDLLRATPGGQIADIVLDSTLSEADIQAQLAKLEKMAQANGGALAIAHPYPITIKALMAWTKALDTKTYVLAPPSAIPDMRQ